MTEIAWCTVFSSADAEAIRGEAAARILAERHSVTIWHAPVADPIDTPLPRVRQLGMMGTDLGPLIASESIVYWLGDRASSDVEQFILRATFENLPGVLAGSASVLAAGGLALLGRASGILVTDDADEPPLRSALMPMRIAPSPRGEDLAEAIEHVMADGESTSPLRRLSSDLATILGHVGIEAGSSAVRSVAELVEDLYGEADLENCPLS